MIYLNKYCNTHRKMFFCIYLSSTLYYGNVIIRYHTKLTYYNANVLSCQWNILTINTKYMQKSCHRQTLAESFNPLFPTNLFVTALKMERILHYAFSYKNPRKAPLYGNSFFLQIAFDSKIP